MLWDRTAPTGPPSGEPQYLGQHTGIQVTEETVRVYLHAMAMSASVSPGDFGAKPRRKLNTWETPQGRGTLRDARIINHPGQLVRERQYPRTTCPGVGIEDRWVSTACIALLVSLTPV
jgi:hypothetical protein